MPLHQGKVLKRELTPQEETLASMLAGEKAENERELVYLVILPEGDMGYLLSISDLPQFEHNKSSIIHKMQQEYFNQDECLGGGAAIPYQNGDQWISTCRVILKQKGIEKVMPLFAERGKDRIYRSETPSANQPVGSAEMKAMLVDWACKRSGETKTLEATIRSAIKDTEGCMTVLALDEKGNAAVVHYDQKSPAGGGVVGKIANWLRTRGWADNTAITAYSGFSNPTWADSFTRYGQSSVIVKNPEAQETLKQMFLDEGLGSQIVNVLDIAYGLNREQESRLFSRLHEQNALKRF